MAPAAKTKHFSQANHSKNLKQMLADYFVSKLFCDVTICCEGQNFEAHKLALSIFSPYFETIFQQDTANHPIVHLPDVTPEVVKYILEYCYKGQLLLPKNKLEGFLQACNTLQIKSLISEDATDESEEEDLIISETDEETNINSNSINPQASIIVLNDSPILIEDSHGQRKNFIDSPSSSSPILEDMTRDNLTLNLNKSTQNSILDSPPAEISSIRHNSRKIPQNADKSPLSSSESFVFNLENSSPVNKKTHSESVIFLTQINDVVEISSEEFACEMDDIQQPGVSNISQDNLNVSASEDTRQIEEDVPNSTVIDNRSVIASDSSDSEISMRKRTKKLANIFSKRLKVNIPRIDVSAFKDTTPIEEDLPSSTILDNRSLTVSDSSESEVVMPTRAKKIGKAFSKRLKVDLPRIELKTSKKDDNFEEDALKFPKGHFTTKVIDIKDVPENKVQFYCHSCRRCVKPFYTRRHSQEHKFD